MNSLQTSNILLKPLFYVKEPLDILPFNCFYSMSPAVSAISAHHLLSIGHHKMCINGLRKGWKDAKKACQYFSGEILLYKDDPEMFWSCQVTQHGIWVGLTKTATVRDAFSKYL